MNNRVSYIELTKEQVERIDNIRQKFSDMFDYIDAHCKPSRETSLAITKIQEAGFWALEAIAREQAGIVVKE